MSLRDIVTGGAACAPSDQAAGSRAGPSNAIGSFVNEFQAMQDSELFHESAGRMGGPKGAAVGVRRELLDNRASEPWNLDEFDQPRVQPGGLAPPSDFTTPLQSQFREFINAVHSGEPFEPRERLDIHQLAPAGHHRAVHDRLTTLGRHMTALNDPELATQQIEALHWVFGLPQDVNELPPQQTVATGSDFAREFLDSGGAAGPVTQEAPPRDWAGEFSRQETPQDRALELAWGNAAVEPGIDSRVEALMQDPKLRDSKFMDFVKKVNDGSLSFDEAGNKLVDRSVHETAEWAEEFRADGSSDWIHEFSGTDTANGQWTTEFEQQNGAAGSWAAEFNNGETDDWADQFGQDWVKQMEQLSMANADRGKYEFQPNNPYLSQEDRFEKGLDLFQRGFTSEAILALEAECQVNAENHEAWYTLGVANAESEQETKAIQALQQCLEINPGNLRCLTALATSYANEAEVTQSLRCLENWVESNAKYKHIHSRVTAETGANDVNSHGNYVSLHDRVTEMLLQAARENPANVDTEVQVALGLVYNLSGEYHKAVECFETALKLTPRDYALWNKLGASLANSTPSRSEDAAGTYLKALEIKPLYPRAIANLGISYTNRGMHREAAEHYVYVLRLNPSATQLWDLLQIALTSMKRPDLAAMTSEKNVNLFDHEFPPPTA